MRRGVAVRGGCRDTDRRRPRAWPAAFGALLAARLMPALLLCVFLLPAFFLPAAAAGDMPAAKAPMPTEPPVELPAPPLPGARLVPLGFGDLDGWMADDHAAAFVTFLASCAALRTPPRETGPASAPTLRDGLAGACAAAARLGTARPAAPLARLFFEANFRPWRVIPDGRAAGFFTGYYEPEVDGALVPGNGFDVPVYGRPADLVMTGPGATPNGGGAMRRDGDRLVPYYDRAAIEDGALAGRGLEIAWLHDPIDLFFMQIQGSARLRLPDGRVLRLNYDGYNGQPYLPVGRLLVERGIVPREEMSMARIRAFMEQDPEAGRLLRRENRSYVFFKALDLGADAGAMGAQGVPLTAGRSIAVDRKLHTYGVPVFVEADLPLAGPGTADRFRRLMIAQDTGSAIVGPARADLFFGAGAEAGAVAGRIRHPGHFTLLVPRFARPGAPAP